MMYARLPKVTAMAKESNMASFEQFDNGAFEAVRIFPNSEALSRQRFRQAFEDLPENQRGLVLRRLADLLLKVGQNIVKFGKTAVYDSELEAIIADCDGDATDQSDALVAFRRGALRDLVASQLKAHGYVVVRRKADGRPSRIVVSFV